MEDYIRFDRFIDLETSLEQLLVQIQGVPMTATCWKWALIAAHSALQSSVCIALRGSAGFDTLKPKDRDKWLDAYENNKDLPNTQLDNFMALFDKLFDKESGIDKELIRKLNGYRNNFIHFNNDGWSIAPKDILDAIGESVSAMVAVPTRSKGVFFYEERQSHRFNALCQTIREKLKELADT